MNTYPSWRIPDRPERLEPPDEIEYVLCCVCGEWCHYDDTATFDKTIRYTDEDNRICVWCQEGTSRIPGNMRGL